MGSERANTDERTGGPDAGGRGSGGANTAGGTGGTSDARGAGGVGGGRDAGGRGGATDARAGGTSAVTRLLRAYGKGDEQALDRLVPLVYDSLRRVAHGQLREERSDHTLSSTALVHEAYLELARLGDVEWKDRRHFFAAAAQTMRHILVDYAVRRNAQKRGGDQQKVPFEDALLQSDENLDDLLALNQALSRLEELDERLVRVVECRYFAGLTIEETAQALGVSEATVSRDWTRARAWLNRELTES